MNLGRFGKIRVFRHDFDLKFEQIRQGFKESQLGIQNEEGIRVLWCKNGGVWSTSTAVGDFRRVVSGGACEGILGG